MDVLAHGLWGGVLFGRRTRWKWRGAFWLGMAPDLLAFGPFFLAQLGSAEWTAFPPYVHQSYNVTHSLVVWAIFTGAVWYFRKAFPWLLCAWGFHIVCDIPLHQISFFPTPYLWPFATPFVDGMRWAQPALMIPNYIALIIAYALMIGLRYRREKAELRHKTIGAGDALR
jgi:hypothetical protein